jgi:acyl carrier protein
MRVWSGERSKTQSDVDRRRGMPNGSKDPDEASLNNQDSLVREFIRKVVGQIAPPGYPDVQPGLILRDELGYDSVHEVELTFALEELFGFESFVVEDAPEMETVEDLENFILDMIAQGRATVPTPSVVEEVESLISEIRATELARTI